MRIGVVCLSMFERDWIFVFKVSKNEMKNILRLVPSAADYHVDGPRHKELYVMDIFRYVGTTSRTPGLDCI